MIPKVVTVTIDRPLGSYHPSHPDIYYPINYGFVDGIMAPDGDWQDAYVLGVGEPAVSVTGEVIAVIHRRDDVEDKWVVAPGGMRFSQKEIRQATLFQERWFDSVVELL